MSFARRAGALGVWIALVVGCSRRELPPPPPPPPPAQVDKDLLESAMHQCFTVDCDAAHARASQIAADSPLRTTDDFRAIEYHYEANRLLAAEGEGDVEKRRARLDAIRADGTVEVGLRSAAARELARLGGGSPFELTLGGVDGGTDAGQDGGADAELTARVAKLLRSKKLEDYGEARVLLEPRIYSGRASPEDVRAMTTICKAQKDESCLRILKTLKLR